MPQTKSSVPFVIGHDPYRDEIAKRLASVDEQTFVGLDAEGQTRYRLLADAVVEYVGEDDFHWGCVSEESAQTSADEAYDAGEEAGFEKAKERVVDGLTRLQNASMVEAETVVEILPRIKAMKLGDEAADHDEPK